MGCGLSFFADDDVKSSHHETNQDDDSERHRPPSPRDAHDINLNRIKTISKSVAIDEKLGVVPHENVDEPVMPPNSSCSTRYLVAYLACLGFLTAFMGRAALSVSMTAMVNSTIDHELYEMNHRNQSFDFQVCKANGPTNASAKGQDGPFQWSSWTQELILASFYNGFPWLQLPAGYLADANGRAAVWLLGFGYGVSAVCTLLTPLAAHLGVPFLMATQVVSGITQGWTFPVFIALMSRWAPPSERSSLVAIGTSGIPLGQVIGQPVAGLWASSEFAGGWPSAFYFSGALGVLWFIVWMCLVYPSPSSHPRISSKEREYIEKSLLHETKKAAVYPWKSMLTSVPVLAVCIADFSLLWILYLFTTNLPIYLKTVLQFDIRQTGFLAAVPFVFYWLVWTVGGRFTDFLIARTKFKITTIRKLLTFLAFMPSSVLLVAMGYVGCNTSVAMVTLTLGLSITGLAMSGASMCQLDFAPRYSGIISAVVNMFAATSGFLAPLLIGRFTENQADPRGWKIVFWTSAGIMMFGLVFFLIFGTAEIQPWARKTEDVNKNGTDDKSRRAESDVSLFLPQCKSTSV
eukprot:XP_795625.3 PREDICTED: sialin isoform X1 [Strongylocentrotus purpuratus]